MSKLTHGANLDDDHPLNAARGIVYGGAISIALWIAIFGVVFAYVNC